MNIVFASQTRPRCPDFKHKVAKDFLWLDGCTSPWVEEELRRRGFKSMSNEMKFEPSDDESPFNIMGHLKACTIEKDLGRGVKCHTYIQEHKLLEKDTFIGSTLVNMYAKCGALSKAKQLLEELPVREVITWNALMTGYAQQGQWEDALKCFDDMLHEGHTPNAVTFTCVLKACGNIGAAAKGEEIHDKIISLGLLERNNTLGSSLVFMYTKCGTVAKAKEVLKGLPFRDVVTWSALITGYVQQGQGEEALKCFDDMLHEGHTPDVVTFICVLRACGSIGAAAKGEEIHNKVVNLGMLQKNVVLGNTLLDMYVKCGALGKARHVLEELPIRNAVTWSVLIAGYAQQGQGVEALKCFDDMLREGHTPDAVTFTSVLKACGSIGAVTKGEEIHDKIVNHGMLEKDIVLGNTLVDMYARCGELTKAQRVLKELPIQNVANWNALIARYAEQGQGEEALKCFDEMLREGYSPDVVTFMCVLKACGNIGAAAKGEKIHEKIVSLGMLEKDVSLGNAVVDMYARCGALAKAQHVLEKLPVRNVVTWSALIAGYAQQGHGEEALRCFDDMLSEGHLPDVVTFICVLKACGSIGAAIKGEEIHNKIVSLGMLEKNVVLGSTLVDMYTRCGALAKAQRVLEELPLRNVVTWSVLIAGYAQQGQGEEALKCFHDMLREGHSPDVVTYICILKACESIGAAAKGKEIHEQIANSGMLEKDIVLWSTLVDMYARCGALSMAQHVFEELPARDVATWNALIAGYAQQGQGEGALKNFDSMLHEGHCPNAVTFICTLKACSSIGAAAKGEEIHDKVVNLGLLQKDIALGNSLVDMYAKCGVLTKAQQLLEELPVRDVVTWNALITGYVNHGQGEEALKCFDDMLADKHCPDLVTFICALKACGSIGAVAKGEEIHEKILRLGMLEKNIILANTLVDMYVKFNLVAKAQRLIEALPARDVVAWSALIAGYTEQGQGAKALKCFDDMLCEGHLPNAMTFTSALKACGSIGSAAKGEEIHDKIVSLGMLENDIALGNVLVDMYAKCGALAKAQGVLENLTAQSVVSWNALITGYAQQGQSFEAINCFEKMQLKGIKPDSVSVNSVLNACSHSGLLHQAETYFSGMSIKYAIHPNLEHYCCMIALYSRAGKFNKALSLIAEMPCDKRLPNWVALLGACCKWGEVEIARLAFERVLCLDKSKASVYVLMADIYIRAGMQEEANKIEALRVANKVVEMPDSQRKYAYTNLQDLDSAVVQESYF